MRAPRGLSMLMLMGSGACAGSHQPGSPGPAREGYVTTSDSARLYYRIRGSGPDTIIAIHGGPGVDLESIAGDFAPLESRHVVVYYDQRGAGRSELPTDTLRLAVARQIADLDEIRTRLGLGRVTLVAHSYGPLLAASYALAHPEAVRRMVFFGPVPPRRGNFWQRFAANVRPGLDSADAARLADANRRLADPAADVRQACRDLWAVALKPRLADPARTLPLIRSDLCASDPRGIRYGLLTTNRVVMASYGDWDLRERLRGLDIPTLIVHGEQEAIPMDLVQEWVTALPRAELLKVPGAAHFTYVEQPGLVWPAVERFLSARSEERGFSLLTPAPHGFSLRGVRTFSRSGSFFLRRKTRDHNSRDPRRCRSRHCDPTSRRFR